MNAVGPAFKRLAFFVAIVALVACVVGWIVSPKQFFISYTFAFLFWFGLSLGSLGWTMIHHLTGGRWGYSTRRFFEAAISSLPLLALLFIPVILGMRALYPWMDATALSADEILRHKHVYLNAPAFVARAIVLFAIWIVMARLLTKWSAEQDATTNPEPTRKLRKLSGPGLVIYPLTMTFAAVDWVMSMERDWFSTIFPILICIGQMLSVLALAILLLALERRRKPLAQIAGPETFHHLGNLLLTFTMLWAYLAFAQLLVIWSGDLPHEISWYLHRIADGWKAIAVLLFLFHFIVPFFLLLSRSYKRRTEILTAIAVTILVAHVVEGWWLIAPSFYQTGVHLSWLDLAAFIGVGGVWFTFFVRQLERRALVPMNDPRFALAIPI